MIGQTEGQPSASTVVRASHGMTDPGKVYLVC